LIVAEGDSTKNEGEDDSHDTNICKFFDVHTDSFENITNFRVIAEDIHYVQEVYGRMEEGSEESNTNID
jgi:hypothetical protein